jgi:DNA-binding MarR family transcriptional regulator
VRRDASGIEREQALRAWARLLRSHAALTRAFNAHLQSGHGLTVSDFEVLHQLSRAAGGRMRRIDLAEAVSLTPSGVTRLLAGLQRAGLVTRAGSESDARVCYACITAAGRSLFAAAAADHVGVLRAIFGERFDAEELATFAELLGRLPGATDGVRERVGVRA